MRCLPTFTSTASCRLLLNDARFLHAGFNWLHFNFVSLAHSTALLRFTHVVRLHCRPAPTKNHDPASVQPAMLIPCPALPRPIDLPCRSSVLCFQDAYVSKPHLCSLSCRSPHTLHSFLKPCMLHKLPFHLPPRQSLRLTNHDLLHPMPSPATPTRPHSEPQLPLIATTPSLPAAIRSSFNNRRRLNKMKGIRSQCGTPAAA